MPRDGISFVQSPYFLQGISAPKRQIVERTNNPDVYLVASSRAKYPMVSCTLSVPVASFWRQQTPN